MRRTNKEVIMNKIKSILCLSLITTLSACVEDKPSYTPYSPPRYEWTPPSPTTRASWNSGSTSNSNSLSPVTTATDNDEGLKKVTDLEEKLKKYGVHFITDSRLDYTYSSGSKEILSVELKTTASKDDLEKLGLKLEDREALTLEMSQLWSELKKAGYGDSDEKTERFAAMKVDLVRSQLMAPKAIEEADKIVGIKKKTKLLLFTHAQSDPEIILWNTQAIKAARTNAEVLKELEESLALHENFQKLKDSFIKDYVRQTEQTLQLQKTALNGRMGPEENLASARRKNLLDLFTNVQNMTLFEDKEAKLVAAEIADLKESSPNKTFDIDDLKDANKKITKDALDTIKTKLSDNLEGILKTIAVSWTKDSSGKWRLAEKELAAARVRMADFHQLVRERKTAIRSDLTKYAQLLLDLADWNEEQALDEDLQAKIEAFLKL